MTPDSCQQLLIVAACLASGSLAQAAHADAAEVELTSIFGVRHYLSEFVDDRTEALVVVVLDDKCPVVQKNLPALRELYRKYNSFHRDRAGRPTEFAKYPGDRVRFLGVYVKPDMGAKGMATHAAQMRIPFRVLHDSQLALVKQLRLTRLSEVAVLNRDLKVQYRGPVDNQNLQGAAKPEATEHYLADAIDAMLAGRPIAIARKPAVGCKITFEPPAQKDSSLTYYRDVAPVIRRRCETCHRAGEVAPMTLQSYDDLVAYAEMVAEVILDERMPPYPGASPREFAYDERLTAEERRTLLEWLRSDREQGDPKDGPGPVAWPDRSRWKIGQPDFVFRMPKPVRVPATGVLNYMYFPVPVNGGKGFAEDRWIESIETHPGAATVVHHVQVHEYFGPVDREPTALDQILIYGLGIESARLLGGYTPGNEEGNKLVFSRYLGENPSGRTAGMKLTKGANLMFEVHYTTNGTATDDQSEVAIRFLDRKPEVVLDTWFPFRSRADMIIPANLENHSLQDLYHFGRETGGRAVLLHGIRPHMHSRGKSFRVELVNPRGLSPAVLEDFSQHDAFRGETILSVPAWDFNWQRFYQFKEPILITPQQALLATAYWDNTKFNPRNPDPNVDAPWGQQTIQEMFNTLLLYEVLEPDDPRAREAQPNIATLERGG
jgi:hypothetical protein